MRLFRAVMARGSWTLGLATALTLSLGGVDHASAASPAKGQHGAWQYLIRGNSAPLLRGWQHPGLPAGWTVHDGVLSKGGPVDDLESTGPYKDFELELYSGAGHGFSVPKNKDEERANDRSINSSARLLKEVFGI